MAEAATTRENNFARPSLSATTHRTIRSRSTSRSTTVRPHASIELKMNTFTENKLRVVAESSNKQQLRKTFSKLLGKNSFSLLPQKDQPPTYYYTQLLRQPNDHPETIREAICAPIVSLPPLESFVFPCDSENYILVLLTEPKVTAQNIEFIIPLKDTKSCIRTEDSFIIIQPTGESHILFGETNEKCGFWSKKLEEICVPVGQMTDQTSSLGLFGLSLVQFRCSFSSKAVFKVIEDTDPPQRLLQGGLLEDIIEFILVHCICESSDSLQTLPLPDALLHCFPLFCSTEAILEISQLVMKKHFPKSTFHKLKKSWQSRFREFGIQLTASTCILSFNEKKYIVELINSVLPKELRIHMLSYLSMSEESRVDVEFTDLETENSFALNPQWHQGGEESIPQEIRIRQIRSIALAEQLTFIEAAFHLQNKELLLDEKNGHLVRMTNWWNKVCSWVATIILQQRTAKDQARIIKKFVKVSRHLVCLRNYSTASQIIAGIQHIAIDRLRRYKEFMTPKSRVWLEKLQQTFSPEENYKKYRKLSFAAPCLRFLAVHQRDMRFILDGNSTFLDPEKQIINFEKVLMGASCLHSLGSFTPAESFKYDIVKDKEVHDFLTKMTCLNEDQLFHLSFALEACRAQEDRIQKKGESTFSNPLFGSKELTQLLGSKSTPSVSTVATTTTATVVSDSPKPLRRTANLPPPGPAILKPDSLIVKRPKPTTL